LTSKRVSPTAAISLRLLEALKAEVQPVLPGAGPTGSVPSVQSLSQLGEMLDHRLLDLQSTVGALEGAYDAWERLCDEEEALLSALAQGSGRTELARAKFDLPDCAENIDGVERFLSEVREQYSALLGSPLPLSPEGISAARRELTSMEEECKEIDDLICSELWLPFARARQVLLSRVGKRVNACASLKALPHALLKRHAEVSAFCGAERELHDFLSGSGTCSSEIRVLREVDGLAGEILRQHLTEHEQVVLSVIVETLGETDSGQGLDLDQVRTKLPVPVQPELVNIVQGLWAKGVLSLKVSL
jgi:hypothetical protein